MSAHRQTEDSREALMGSAAETAERLGRRPWPPFVPLRSRPGVSFEFFPPRNESAAASLRRCIDRLAPLNPDFASVTYGAGGTTRDSTLTCLQDIIARTNVPAAGHLTCVSASRDDVMAVVDQYIDAGIRHVVALRGDAPAEADRFTPHPDGFACAAELVAAIRTRHDDMQISVAAYPEAHPDSPSVEADLENLKRKADAGATSAITQFFFEPESYLRFLDRARAAGISIPIVPGILPITNFRRAAEFAERCGTTMPRWMTQLFDGLDDSPQVRSLVSATVTAELCRRLAEHGVQDFHFYTLNQSDLTIAVCHVLGLRAEGHEAQGADEAVLETARA